MNPTGPHVDRSQIVIRQPANEAELAKVRTLRQEELNGDQPLPGPVQPTEADLDPHTLHMAAFHGERVVSAVRVNPQAEPPGAHYISRMVTHHDYRGHGIGSDVLAAAEAAAQERGATRFELKARPRALSFYDRAGYTPIPPGTPDDKGHLPMEKTLAV